MLGGLCQRLLAVFGLDHLVAGVCQHIAQDLSVVLLVLDHEYALFHACATCCSTLTGTVTKKVAPLPTLDSTQIFPPCISMMRRAIDNPNPVPPFFLVAELSACWNSSK